MSADYISRQNKLLNAKALTRKAAKPQRMQKRKGDKEIEEIRG